MKCDWQTLTLQQAGVSLLDCEHRTPPASGDGFPYIAIPQIKNGRLDLLDARMITEEHFEDWTRKTMPQPFDVVLSRRCNPGETAFIPPGLKCALGQNLVLLRANGEGIFPPFLRWLARGDEWWEQVERFLNHGAVFESLKCADIPNFELSVPPLNDQHAIARVLGALDDKIELNRRMNRTLEGLATALFRSWFVDFDPVVSKAAGRKLAHLRPDLAALFPASFQDSPLGPIPRGWCVAIIGDIAENPRRIADPTSIVLTTPYIGLEHMPRKSICLGEWGTAADVSSAKSRFQQGEILFGKLRPYFHKVGIATTDGVCSTDVLVVSPKAEAWFGILAGHLSSEEFIDYADAASGGTRMPRASWKDMKGYQIALPPEPLAQILSVWYRRTAAMLAHNVRESRTLAALRDTLLPKLLSGELRVKSAKKDVTQYA